ncbi:MAG: 6-bladed beta-propeller, partial [Prolixibacteraceae bacterium]|nr:6-bladed beta-propeller [Prolixibacteraceae bacterium]
QASIVSPVNLSKVFLGVDHVHLHGTPSLINIIFKVIKTNKYLFIADAQPEGVRIIKFDNKGNFHKVIGNTGHGPGEYLYFMDFCVDTVNERVIIAAFNQIIGYDFDGKLIGNVPINVFRTNDSFVVDYITCIDTQIWTFQRRMVPPISEGEKWLHFGELIRYDDKLNVIDTIPVIKASLDINQGTYYRGKYCLSDLGEDLYIYYPITDAEPLLRDTLYILKKGRIEPAIKLDFSTILSTDKSINLKKVNLRESFDPIHKIRNMIIHNVYRTPNYIFTEYQKGDYIYNNEYYLFCFDLRHSLSYNMRRGFTDDLYNTGITSLKPSDLLKGEFYFIKNGYELDGIIEGVNENSNPVIFFVRTREEGNNEEMKK